MNLKIRRTYTIVENRSVEAGKAATTPLRKVAAVVVVRNPFAGRYVKNLNPLIEASAALGRELAVILCLANRGRLNARVGGLRHDQLKGENGLV